MLWSILPLRAEDACDEIPFGRPASALPSRVSRRDIASYQTNIVHHYRHRIVQQPRTCQACEKSTPLRTDFQGQHVATMSLSDSYNPFALAWSVPSIKDDDDDDPLHWEGFKLKRQNESTALTLADIQSVTLPRLKSSTFQLELDSPPLDSIDTVAADQDVKHVGIKSPKPATVDDHDIWTLVDIQQPDHSQQPASWEKFNNHYNRGLSVALLSEVDIDLYDAFLKKSFQHTRARHVCPNIFLRAVANLIIGQDSTLFRWNPSRAQFEEVDSAYVLSGFNRQCTANVVHKLLGVGDRFKRLKTFAKTPKPCYASSISLAGCIAAILRSVEEYVFATDVSGASFLSLYQIASRTDEILRPLTKAIGTAKSLADQTAFLAGALNVLETASLENLNIQCLMHHICAIMAKPALDSIVAFVTGQAENFDEAKTYEHDLKSLGLRNEGVFKDLLHHRRLIRQTHYRAPEEFGILEPQPAPSVMIAETWNDILILQQEADSFESASLRSRNLSRNTKDKSFAMVSRDSGPEQNGVVDPFGFNFELHQSYNMEDHVHPNGNVLALVRDHLEGVQAGHTDFTPIQSITLSVAPLMQAQNRLASYELLELAFSKFKLLEHLDLLHNFLLFGDSNFVGRLCTALFDTSQVGSTNARRQAGITGLRLEHRESWPPASSELRLVLMNVLLDSSSSNITDDLRDHFSFAIRELSPADIEKCKDLHSVHALKFLKLVYSSNDVALEAAISTDCLNKYDRIFQHLLLLVRLHYLSRYLLTLYSSCNSTATDNSTLQRTCIKLHHLTTQVLSYSLEVAIPIHWQPFRGFLQQAKSHVEDEHYKHVMELVGTFSDIEIRHQATLDRIIDGLLLSEEHKSALGYMVEIFTAALELHKSVTSTDRRQIDAVGDIVAKISTQLRVFLRALKLAVKTAHSEASTTHMLLERMTLSGFYTENRA